jgi:P27 family predicted phage terminase small subunit
MSAAKSNGKPRRAPAVPRTLGTAGQAAWTIAWAQPWISAADRRQVEHLCRLEDQAEVLCEQLDKLGPMLKRPIVSPRGDVVGVEAYENPSLKGLRALDKQLLLLRASLGLDPQSRARMRLEVEDAPSLLDLLNAKRQARIKGKSTATLDRRFAELKSGEPRRRTRAVHS